jgi:hypothetical protein
MSFLRNILLFCVCMSSAPSFAEGLPEFKSVSEVRSFRAKLFTSFHVAQSKLYLKDGKGTAAEIAAYQAVVDNVVALQLKASTLRLKSDLGKDQADYDAALERLVNYLSSAKVRSNPPFTKADLNDVGQLLGRIEQLLNLPLREPGPFGPL